MTIKQVKVSIIQDINKKSGWRYFYYTDIPNEGLDWNSVDEYLPDVYDLILLKTSTGKKFKGWLSHRTWDGMKMEENDIVKYWKLGSDLT